MLWTAGVTTVSCVLSARPLRPITGGLGTTTLNTIFCEHQAVQGLSAKGEDGRLITVF